MPTDGGHPLVNLQHWITPEVLAWLQTDPERRAFVKEFSQRVLRDPAFLSQVEHAFREFEPVLGKTKIPSVNLESFGWDQAAIAMPSPQAAVAAVAAAVAALVACCVPV